MPDNTNNNDITLAAKLKQAAPLGTDIDRIEPIWAELYSDADPDVIKFMASVFRCSSFLRESAVNESQFLARALEQPPEASFNDLVNDLATAPDMDTARRNLRLFKRRATLLIGLCDLAAIWDIATVGKYLSDMADHSVRYALDHCWRELLARRNLAANKITGYSVIAMGKHGARELNFSSDIDLVIIYDDRDNNDSHNRDDNDNTIEHKHFIQLTKKLVAFLQERTIDGYVFRVDLRLRPDPNVTTIAISLNTALTYYENFGLNWERAAFIKARVIAGDIELGKFLLHNMQPFIWRKYLDFATLIDIQAIKNQINTYKVRADLELSGHNIKLGYGGIREIEFFVQTQQLIAGGRNNSLRGRRTVAMLHELANAKWIEQSTAIELEQAYAFLRLVENRLQVINDEQTHALPANDNQLASIAAMMQIADLDEFKRQLSGHLKIVRNHYSNLFRVEKSQLDDNKPHVTTIDGNLFFTGNDDDPETIKTLTNMGFVNVQAVATAIRSWHIGRYNCLTSAKSRHQLQAILPQLLQAFAASTNPDDGLLNFDRFLAALPSGFQLLALLRTNPQLMQLTTEIMAMAPKLGAIAVKYPYILSSLLEPTETVDNKIIYAQLAKRLRNSKNYEETLDLVRIFVREEKFKATVDLLSAKIDIDELGLRFADIADAVIATLLAKVKCEFEREYGTVANSKLLVMAMGKLGGQEMSFASDLDLIIIYENEGNRQSDGAKSLDGYTYFNRLTKRLVAALSAPTSKGDLYEVDMRLRPSGNSGPLATTIQAFASYQQHEAWVWEHMALTKARVVAGDDDLKQHVNDLIKTILTTKRHPHNTAASVKDMRIKIANDRNPKDILDVKNIRGGLVDIEFIVQFMQLAFAADNPQILSANTGQATIKLSSLIGKKQADELNHIHKLYQLIALLRDIGHRDSNKIQPQQLKIMLANINAVNKNQTIEKLISSRQKRVMNMFDLLIN